MFTGTLRSKAVVALLVTMALLPAAPAVPANAAPAADCPTIMPVFEVQRGMVGEGWTVTAGTTPDPFDAEILGVLPDALLPGRDLIVAEVDSPKIDRVGGVWYGMSGSPVYVGDQLVGAIAFGLGRGPSRVIGLTPAEDMAKVLAYPTAAGAQTASAPERVTITDSMQRTIARSTSLTAAEVDDSFVQLKMPLSVSGTGARGMRSLARRLNHRDFSVRAFAGSAVSATAVGDLSTIVPGGNFAAALSYGDVTVAGVGTTTIVCNGAAMAFGHPLEFSGPASVGANTADAITIWEDPVFSPFKVATIGGTVGIVDQDRFAGIRARLGGGLLRTIPVTSTTTSEDTGRTRVGRTEAVVPDLLSEIAPFHAYANVVSAMDQYSGGSGELTWTVRGTRADGSRWRLTRSNMVSSGSDLPFESIFEALVVMHRLSNQRFEDIEFTRVAFSINVREAIRQLKIANVLISKNGGPFRSARGLAVRPGARLAVRVKLDPFGGGPVRSRTLRLRIPRRAAGLYRLNVFGADRFLGKISADSFGGLLSRIAKQPTNNQLGATLEKPRGVVARTRAELSRVVVGGRSIFLQVGG
jgi:hypothetical protein